MKAVLLIVLLHSAIAQQLGGEADSRLSRLEIQLQQLKQAFQLMEHQMSTMEVRTATQIANITEYMTSQSSSHRQHQCCDVASSIVRDFNQIQMELLEQYSQALELQLFELRGHIQSVGDQLSSTDDRISTRFNVLETAARRHLDHFESLIEELETISRASVCHWEKSEIIMYIIGAVLHKLKKPYARSNRSDDLDVIKGLISHENKKDPRPSLIAVKSRGGLLTFVEALEPLMRIAYQKFKTGLKSSGLFSVEVMATCFPEESSISDLDDSHEQYYETFSRNYVPP
ncbi:hypothetical protein CAPTEDRAFT_206361 [Capitella teleta]|uniref:Uncharacterized protein n=1 Tax=Capitella teleta TaxID=283909 RepID=R7UK78_CAPTE|nr:hypothetical protein CAPTEDRAFT_206361 [Capitella teleta]|eukprot:ELU03687.1 hypothetical protein CAPTEDRAFT_206361 [Capitella teleta]